jgi:hypothetical protein
LGFACKPAHSDGGQELGTHIPSPSPSLLRQRFHGSLHVRPAGCFSPAFPQGSRLEHSGSARGRPPGASQKRSAGKQLDQFRSLSVAEAADRLRVGDPTAGERTIGPGGTDPRDDQEQLPHLRRLHAGRRVGDHPRQLDAASGDSSLQLRACDANLVRLHERAQALLGRPSKGCGCAAHN